MFVRAYSPSPVGPRCTPPPPPPPPPRTQATDGFDSCTVGPPPRNEARDQAHAALNRIFGPPVSASSTPSAEPLPEPSSTRGGKVLDVLSSPPPGVDAAAFRAEVVRYAEERHELGNAMEATKTIDREAVLALGVQGLSAAETASLRTQHPEQMKRVDALIQAGPEKVRDATLAATAKSEALTAAREKLGPLNERLAGELAQVGPALTDAQRERYTQDFRASHPEYADEKRLVGELVSLTGSKRDALNAAIVACSQTALPTVIDAYAAVARSSDATKALDWLETMPPQTRAAVAASPLGVHIGDEVIGPAITSLAAKTCGDFGSDRPDPRNALAAVDAFESALQNYQRLGEWGLSVTEIGASVDEARTVQSAVGNGRMHDVVAQLQRDVEGAPWLMRSVHAAGVLFGAKSAFDSGQHGDWLQALSDAGNAGKSGLELVDTIATAAQAGTDVAKSSSKVARLIPIVGLVADSLAVIGDTGKLFQTGNAGYAVKVLGDFFSLAGNVPVVGAVGDAVGIALDVCSDWLIDAIDDERSRSEIAARLQRIDPRRFDAATARALSRENLQLQPLSPDQLVELARAYPEALHEENRLLTVLAQGEKLRPNEVMCLLAAVELDARAEGKSVHEVLNAAEESIAMGYADQYSQSDPGTAARKQVYQALLSKLGATPQVHAYLKSLGVIR